MAPQGFNRNGFGNMQGWNQWGSNNWGLGWNNWGSGYGYWAGPVFWPFFYGDVMTYAMWPYGYYDPFFLYGSNFLLSSIFWPGPYVCPVYGYCPDYGYNYAYGPYDDAYGYDDYSMFDVYGAPYDGQYYTAYSYGRHRHHRRHHVVHRYVNPAPAPAPVNVAASCGGLAPGVTQLPIDRIRTTIGATDEQMTLLDQLQAASSQANAILLASCPASVPLTPVGRLDAVSGRLLAMIQAMDVLRGPLTRFYNSLDDNQRLQLAAVAGRGRKGRANIAVNEAPARDLAALCQKQAQSFTLLPVQRIDDVVKPTGEQQTAFDGLKTASTAAATGLGASCPSDVPQTMEGRLDAVSARLHALEDAVNTVRPALKAFYDSLSDEQKARFNVIGGANMAATPQNQGANGAGR